MYGAVPTVEEELLKRAFWYDTLTSSTSTTESLIVAQDSGLLGPHAGFGAGTAVSYTRRRVSASGMELRRMLDRIQDDGSGNINGDKLPRRSKLDLPVI